MSKATTRGPKLLEQFLGEYVVLFLQGLNTEISNEEQTAVVPLVCEGILYDFDDRFLLLGSEDKTAFSLINMDNIGKLDSVDRELDALNDPDKPHRGDMN